MSQNVPPRPGLSLSRMGSTDDIPTELPKPAPPDFRKMMKKK